MDLSKLFDSFYNRFILRDIFGKIVPGTILFYCALSLLYPTDRILNFTRSLASLKSIVIQISALALLAGLTWALGFLAQQLGHTIHWTRDYPRTYDNNTKIRLLINFSRNATEIERRQAERLALIKEVCGNCSTSLRIFLVLLVLKEFLSLQNTIPKICLPDFPATYLFFAFLFVGIISLRSCHHWILEREHLYMDIISRNDNIAPRPQPTLSPQSSNQ